MSERDQAASLASCNAPAALCYKGVGLSALLRCHHNAGHAGAHHAKISMSGDHGPSMLQLVEWPGEDQWRPESDEQVARSQGERHV